VSGAIVMRSSDKASMSFPTASSPATGIVEAVDVSAKGQLCSCFAPSRLIPRLVGFYAAHPEIGVQLRLYAQDPELTDQVADAFVTALPVKPGFAAVHVVDERLVAVRAREPRAAIEQRRSHLITTDIDEGKAGQDWVDFCTVTGLRLQNIQAGYGYNARTTCPRLKWRRQDFLAAHGVDAGSIVYFDRTAISSKRGYHLCCKRTRGQHAEVKALAQWITALNPG
jgi:LysR family glycine cleavage system transcriptional activator